MKKIYLTLLSALSFATIYAQCPVQVQVTPCTCFGVCNGSAMAFGSGNGPFTYNWNTIPSQTTQTATGLCAGTYTVIVINGSLCTGTATATITQPTQITSVTTGQNPNSCINCNGIGVGTASGGTPPYTYSWTPGNSTTTTCTGLCAGTYTFTTTDSHGCSHTSTLTLTNPGTPAFSVSSTPANQPNCNNGTATVTLGNPGTYTYSWSPITQTTQTATGLSNGNYTVCVTNTGNGCSACQPVTVSCVTGIENYSSSLGVNIYPNPASGSFTLQFSGEKTGEMSFEIFNVVGEEIFSQQINVSKQLTKQIDIYSYPKGIYFVRIKGSEGMQTMKLIVQ